tara:strand:- start:15 stop:224 length:210 start_codon:yes stop_codon:yes gene_type:complete
MAMKKKGYRAGGRVRRMSKGGKAGGRIKKMEGGGAVSKTKKSKGGAAGGKKSLAKARAVLPAGYKIVKK